MVTSGTYDVSCACMLGLYSLLLSNLGQANPILPPKDNLRGRGILDPLLLEQTEGVDIQELLGNFLSVLNLTNRNSASVVSGPPQPPTPRVEPSEYMLELYNRFANDHSVRPTGNTVRSFKNQDTSAMIVTNGQVMIHPLLFNISMPYHETVLNAELRLYTLVPRNRQCPPGEHKVTIFELHKLDGQWGSGGESDKDQKQVPVKREQITSRLISIKESGWEVFELTDAVQNWKESTLATHYLEVHIESLYGQGQVARLLCQGETEDSLPPMLDIDRDVAGKHSPVLIVFSDDLSKDHQDAKEEMDEMIDHEFDLLSGNELWANRAAPVGNTEDAEALMHLHSNMIYDTVPRVRRSAADKYCKKTPLYVKFKDIGWDSWIAAPEGYQANACRGQCQIPLTDDVSPTKHATIQGLINIKFPKRVSQPCCVPTKLDPISILYKDHKGVITIKHKYEDMVVAECGCR